MLSRRSFLAALVASLPTCLPAQTPHTPLPGSVERKAIADAMRKVVRTAFGEADADFIFVFRTLRVEDGWAWAEAEPQRTGGASGQFDSVSFLLRNSSGTWKVVASLPDEVVSASDPDAARRAWLKKSLPAKHRGLPKGLVPAA